MNTITKTVIHLQMIALLLTTALADPASAETGMPFRGDVEGTETQDFRFNEDGMPTGFAVTGSGTGEATHLEEFTATWEFPDAVIDQTTGNVSGNGSRRFVAANGDILVTEGTAAGTPPDPATGIASVRETHIIIGGTGRFAGASGNFILERETEVGPDGPKHTSGSFDGTIFLSLPATFLRGDCSGDGKADIADVTCALDWLFAGGSEPGCLAAANTNGDDKVDIADPVSLLNFLFGGGTAPAAPFPDCGPGTLEADEQLGCANPPVCQ